MNQEEENQQQPVVGPTKNTKDKKGKEVKPENYIDSEMEKLMNTQQFVSQKFKPMQDVFICYEQDEFFDSIQPKVQPSSKNEFIYTSKLTVDQRLLFRQKRAAYNPANNKNQM